MSVSVPAAGSGECPVCGEFSSFRRFEVARQQGGAAVDILICSNCQVLLNTGAYERLSTSDERDAQKTDFYARTTTSYKTELENIATSGAILEYLFSKLSRPWKDLTFCDLGAGRGYAAHAASKHFRCSIACEFDTTNIESVCKVVGRPSNLQIVDDVQKITGKIDVLFAWHVMEHIPDLHRFLTELKGKLADDCTIFMQCPGYRPDTLVDCHYLFFNEISLRETMCRLGFREVEIGFDIDCGFVAYIGNLERNSSMTKAETQPKARSKRRA